MLDLSPLNVAVVVLVSAVAGVFKVAFGLGAGAFLTPVLALVLPPKLAIGLMWPVMFVTDLSALRHHWRKWDTRHVLVLLPTCLLGVVAGSLFLAWAPSWVVRKTIGVIALAFCGVQLLRMGRAASGPSHPMPTWGGWIVGFVAGLTTSIAHSGGIVMSIYLLTVGLTKNRFIATLVSIFFASNLLKFPLYWQTGILTMPALLTGLALTPAMLLGGRFGMSVNRRLSVAQFTRFVVAIIGSAGMLLLATP